MPLHANYDLIAPSERVKRNNARRWSDSPTLLRDCQSQSDRSLNLPAGHELTQSLHDLSTPPVHPISKMSSGSQINLSSTTLQSDRTSKSRDSGFNKSASCISLNSTNTKYSHVESKVKKYVQSIKEAEALRRKSMSTDSVNNFVPECNVEVNQACAVAVDRDVDQVINKMQSELRDKDRLIDALQGSYDDLLLKFAEAENKIDRLRIRSLHNSPNQKYRSSQQFSDEFEFKSLLLSNHMPDNKREFHHLSQYRTPEEGLDDSMSFSFSESSLHSPSLVHSKSDVSQSCQKEVVISAPLRPVQKLYCTSVRLDKVLPSLCQLSSKSEASKSVHEMQASAHQLPVVTEDPCDSKAEREEAFSLVKYTAAETGMSTNFCHATTDTGIEDCVQSMTDNTVGEDQGEATAGRLSLEPEFKRILNIPDEDAIAKVQRWRESLPDDVIGQKKEATTKPKKHRSKKLALPKTSIGVQTCAAPDTDTRDYFSNDSFHLQAPAPTWIKMRESSDVLGSVPGGSVEITDCDNCSSEMNRKFGRRRAWSPAAVRLRQESSTNSSKNKPGGIRTKHQCSGECQSCGRIILAPDKPLFEPSSSVSDGGPRERTKVSYHKAKSGFERTDKNAIRRELHSCRKSSRCLRQGSFSRAVLLDMLLSMQTAHSCCGCCQHTWRGRSAMPFSALLQGGTRSSCQEGNSLQQCLDEIQEIAWELKDNLAASHERLAHLVRKPE